jgi:regulator of nucleoside diphosphate kinase
MSLSPNIVVAAHDLEALRVLVDAHDTPVSQQLDAELARAHVVADVPADAVVMNRVVVYRELVSGTERRVRVVYPRDADADQGRVSVLAPLGCALLGLRVGQEIDWAMPGGPRRLRIVSVAA